MNLYIFHLYIINHEILSPLQTAPFFLSCDFLPFIPKESRRNHSFLGRGQADFQKSYFWEWAQSSINVAKSQ